MNTWKRFQLKLLKSHFRHPRGLLGRITAKRMERVNAPQNQWMREVLNIQGHESILEIGFGDGNTIYQLAPKLTTGQIHGLEMSKLMLEKAKKRNKKFIEADKVSLHLGTDVTKFSKKFDVIFAVHVVYFWEDLETELIKLHKVLNPGGKVYLYFVHPVWEYLRSGNTFVERTPSEVQETFEHNGYTNHQILKKQFDAQQGYIVVGELT